MFDHSVAHVLTLTKRGVIDGLSVGAALDQACEKAAKGDADFQARLDNAATGWLITARQHLAEEGEPLPGALQVVRGAQRLVNERLP